MFHETVIHSVSMRMISLVTPFLILATIPLFSRDVIALEIEALDALIEEAILLCNIAS